MAVAVLARAVIAPDADALAAIRADDVAMAVWERTVPPDLAALARLDTALVRLHGAPSALAQLLAGELAAAGFPAGAASAWLAADMAMLAARFAGVMEVAAVDLRLERVTGDACRKFHADFVTARLICTYAGPGTQWRDPVEAADCDCGDDHSIRQLGAGDVALLKGRLWSETAPAIHRSPPIAGTGTARLLLVINAVDPATAAAG